MSAIRGISIDFFIFPTASAASIFGTAARTSSHPAFSKALICLTVAFTSAVSVFVMDWTEIGELLPIFMLPTEICLVFLRFMVSIIQKNRLKTKEHNENLQTSALSLTTWGPMPDSNRHGTFPPRDFKSRASTSSATRAKLVISLELGVLSQRQKRIL